MNNKDMNNKNYNSLDLALQEYAFEYETACSHEFSYGCFLMQEDNYKEYYEM